MQILLLAFLKVVLASDVLATTCGTSVQPLQVRLETSDLIFIGKLARVLGNVESVKGAKRHATVTAEEVFKGEVRREYDMFYFEPAKGPPMPLGDTSICDENIFSAFGAGNFNRRSREARYLFFAKKIDGHFYTSERLGTKDMVRSITRREIEQVRKKFSGARPAD